MNPILKHNQQKAKLDATLDNMDKAIQAYEVEREQLSARNLGVLSLAGYRSNIDNLFNQARRLGWGGDHPLAHETSHNLGLERPQDEAGIAQPFQVNTMFQRQGWPVSVGGVQ